MITEDKLKEQLKPFHDGVKKAKKLLPEVLNDDEVIKGLCKTSYNNENGLWVFTNARLFFISSKQNIQKEYVYEQLQNISIDTGFLSNTITLDFKDESIKLATSSEDILIILDFIKDKICNESNKTQFLNNYLHMRKKIKNKFRIGYFVVIAIVCMFIYSCANQSNTPKESNTPAAEQSTEKTVEPQKEDTSTQNTETASDKIKDICKDKLGSQLISVEVNDNIGKNDGSKIVLVHLKGQTGVSDNGSQKMMLRQSRDLLEELYTSGQPISEVTTFSEATMVDKYGKETQTVVMKCTLKSDTAAKIEWKNKGSIDFTQVLDNYWVSPSLRSKK